MKKTIKIMIILLVIGFLFSGCDEEKIESKNMEQIYKEEGVPIKVEKIEKKAFERELTYNTILSGNKGIICKCNDWWKN